MAIIRVTSNLLTSGAVQNNINEGAALNLTVPLAATQVSASGVSIGSSTINAKAVLDVTSTTQGFLPPRMTTEQRNAIAEPPAGLMLYDTTSNSFNGRTNSAWISFVSSTGTETLTNKTISGGTMSGTLTFNSTTYTYGEGLAAAHRTALGLTALATTTPAANVATFLATPTTENFTAALDTTAAEFQSKAFSNSLMPSPMMSFFDDCDGRYAYTPTQSGSGGSIADADNSGRMAYGVYRVMSGAVSNYFYRAFVRISGGVKAIGTTFQTTFAIQDITSCEFFTGFTWVGIGQFGLAYRSGLDGGLFTFRHGGSNFAVLPSSTAAPQNGNFMSGKRYKFTMTQLTNTTSQITIEEANFDSAAWTTLYAGVVTHGSRLSAGLGMCPSVEILTKTNAQRACFVDYFRFENPTFLR